MNAWRVRSVNLLPGNSRIFIIQELVVVIKWRNLNHLVLIILIRDKNLYTLLMRGKHPLHIINKRKISYVEPEIN
jgi:hypothetical protein